MSRRHEALLDIITSANVACGFHAGDPSTMLRVCASAVAAGVTIGAQVGYRDLVGFGRRRMDISPGDLTADVLYQLGALHACACASGGVLAYVEPHGALYNTAAEDPVQAGAIVEAIVAYDRTLPLLGLPGSAMADAAAAAGVRFVAEAFADRAYLPNGRLAPRSDAGAVLTDPAAIAGRALGFVSDGSVDALDGSTLTIAAESVCVHGDTPEQST